MSRSKTMGEAAPRTGRSKSRMVVLILVLLILTVAFHSTMLLIGFAMLPTMAAFVFDTDGSRNIVPPVGLLNAAGTLPAVLDLWGNAGHSSDYAMTLMHDPFTWLVAYCAAGMGWLIYFSVPMLVSYFLAQRARAHIAELESQQAELRRLWGG